MYYNILHLNPIKLDSDIFIKAELVEGPQCNFKSMHAVYMLDNGLMVLCIYFCRPLFTVFALACTTQHSCCTTTETGWLSWLYSTDSISDGLTLQLLQTLKRCQKQKLSKSA